MLFQKYKINNYLFKTSNYKKKVGVICLENGQNVGNILVKFAMFKKLEEYGFNVTIIASGNFNNPDLSFIKRTIKSRLYIIKNNFSELNENDYDYLLVNSDQTWSYGIKHFFDVAFLRFAKNWNVKKFIYGASLSNYRWFFRKRDEEIAKSLLKNFTGISFREIGTIKLAEDCLGIKGVFVLDPTLLIDRQYYLNVIQNYKADYNSKENFIFVYQLNKNKIIEKVINDSSKILQYQIYKHQKNRKDYVESFLFGVIHCRGIITDSFHGTIFSIIFDKPFISFMNKGRGKKRFDSLNEVFNLGKRIIDTSINNNIDINLLSEKPRINKALLTQFSIFSINYLKKNLDLL